MNRPRGVTIELLAKRSKKKFSLRDQVDAIVKTVDALILTAHDNGRSSIEPYELPSTIPEATDQKKAQVMLYSELILIYQEKGFADVKIDFSRGKPYLCIRWENTVEQEDLDMRMKIIDAHRC